MLVCVIGVSKSSLLLCRPDTFLNRFFFLSFSDLFAFCGLLACDSQVSSRTSRMSNPRQGAGSSVGESVGGNPASPSLSALPNPSSTGTFAVPAPPSFADNSYRSSSSNLFQSSSSFSSSSARSSSPSLTSSVPVRNIQITGFEFFA